MSKNQQIVEVLAIARGLVQGVGFRATAQSLATKMGLAGSVSNLPDGSVEIYVQGSKEKVLLFLEQLNHRWQSSMEPLIPIFKEIIHTYEGFVVKG